MCHDWAEEDEGYCKDFSLKVVSFWEACYESDWDPESCDWEAFVAVEAEWYPSCSEDWESVWEWEHYFYEYEGDYHDFSTPTLVTDGTHYCDTYASDEYAYSDCTSTFEFCNGWRNEAEDTCIAAFEAEQEFWARCEQEDCTSDDYDAFYANLPNFYPETEEEWEAYYHWYDNNDYWTAIASVDVDANLDLDVDIPVALAKSKINHKINHKIAHSNKHTHKSRNGHKTNFPPPMQR